MTITLGFYADAGGTTLAASPLPLVQDSTGILSPALATVYLLSNASGKKFQAVSNPGVDQVQVMIDDQSPLSGQPATAIKLALSEAGLSSAIAGAPLSIGVTVLSGVANAIPVWVQFDDSTAVVATDNNIRLITNALYETDV
jgi:hypothetical protein